VRKVLHCGQVHFGSTPFAAAALIAGMLFAATAASRAQTPTPAASQAQDPTPAASRAQTPAPAAAIASSIADTTLRSLIRQVMERNPEVAAQAAAAAAAGERPAQAGALPDPMVGATAFAMAPETRVGPQRAMVSVSQRIPWFGKLGARRDAAGREAASARAREEGTRLRLLTEARRLYYELGFLRVQERILKEDRSTLSHYEELARARYATGGGGEQAVVKIQADITRDDARLLELASRRAALLADLNALRDRPESEPVVVDSLPPPPGFDFDPQIFRERALSSRPEMFEAQAQIEKNEALTRAARKESGPDLTLGLSYTFVGRRSDPAGLMSPPPDNGQDILGVTAGVSLPIWRGRISAGVREAVARKSGAEETKRGVIAAIDRSLGDLAQRIPLTWERLRLLEDVLAVQAEQSLRSAEAGYAAGNLGALDLLDAERTLLDVRVAAARAHADYVIAVAQLEGTMAAPLREAE